MVTYLHRIADQELEQRLCYIGAVLIEGPKACGKTATATRHAETVIRLDVVSQDIGDRYVSGHR